MNRLYNEMVSYEEEVERVQQKYNREVVSEITGLTGNDLLDFMMYCRFSYYDLVRWSDEQIREKVRALYFNYQYDKINIEYEKIENELKALHQAFPGDMKAALLQAAMQGKLTEQKQSSSPSVSSLVVRTMGDVSANV